MHTDDARVRTHNMRRLICSAPLNMLGLANNALAGHGQLVRTANADGKTFLPSIRKGDIYLYIAKSYSLDAGSCLLRRIDDSATKRRPIHFYLLPTAPPC